jgi:hypothetical protein
LSGGVDRCVGRAESGFLRGKFSHCCAHEAELAPADVKLAAVAKAASPFINQTSERQREMKKAIATTIAAFALTGCASIFNGQTQPVTITSVPEGADVSVVNAAGEKIHTGQTPITLTLKRGAG